MNKNRVPGGTKSKERQWLKNECIALEACEAIQNNKKAKTKVKRRKRVLGRDFGDTSDSFKH